MLLAAGSCFATLLVVFGLLAYANRKELRAWIRDLLAASLGEGARP